MKKKKKTEDKADTLAKERLDEKKITEGLQAIYGEEGEVDFSKVEKKKRSAVEVLVKLVIFLGLSAVIGWSGFFVYQQFSNYGEIQTLELEIDGPAEIISGEYVVFSINYNFPFETSLASLLIDLNIPQGFYIDSFSLEPTNKEDLIWRLGSQPRATSGEIEIGGRWFAEVPSVHTLQAFARYKPVNVNAEFEEINTLVVRTESSVANLEIDGPDEATSEDELTYTFTVRNNGDELMPVSRLIPEIPSGFVISSSSPEFDPGFAPVWNIESMEAGEEKEFRIIGTYATDVSGFSEWSARLQFDQRNQRVNQAEHKFYTDVAVSDLQVQLLIGGQNEILVLEPNSMMQTSILLENTSNNALSGISALLDFSAENRMPVRWSAAVLGSGRLTSAGIRYDEASIGDIDASGNRALNAQFPIEAQIGDNDSRLLMALVRIFRGNRELRSRTVRIYISTKPNIEAIINSNGEAVITVKAGDTPLSNLQMRIPFVDANSLILAESESTMGEFNFAGNSRINWQIDRLDAGQSADLIIRLNPDEINMGSGSLLIEAMELTGVYEEIEEGFRETLSGLRY